MTDTRPLLFQLQESLDGIRRTGVMNLATVTTVALSLSILGGFLLGLRNMNRWLDNLQSVYEVTVFLEPGTGDEVRKLLRQNLTLDPAVLSARFVSRDEALAQLEADLRQSGQEVPRLDENPLAYRAHIQQGIDFPAFRQRLAAYPGVGEIASGQDWVEQALALVKLTRAVGLVLVLVLGGASLLIIANTIALSVHSRRDEIEIMKLVGATNWFIRTPFLIEGLLQGSAGALLAVVLVFAGYSFLAAEVHEITPSLPLITAWAELARMAVQLLFMGMILGLLGALLSLRKILV